MIFLDTGNNFEKQLISDGFQKEIKNAIKRIELPNFTIPKLLKAEDEKIEKYTDNQLLKIISNKKHKTQYSPVIAEEIVKAGKIPPKISDLFKIIGNLI